MMIGQRRIHLPGLATLFLLIAAAAGVGACNTIEGAGRDISNAGQTIEKTADGNK